MLPSWTRSMNAMPWLTYFLAMWVVITSYSIHYTKLYDHLAFVSNRSGSTAVWKLPRLGGDPVLLVPDADYPSISPDGKQIAYGWNSYDRNNFV